MSIYGRVFLNVCRYLGRFSPLEIPFASGCALKMRRAGLGSPRKDDNYRVIYIYIYTGVYKGYLGTMAKDMETAIEAMYASYSLNS